MPTIQGLTALMEKLAKLRERYTQGAEDPVVIVGYTASYAVYVHERQAKHTAGKQWKFLEQPARELSSELGEIIRTAIAGGTAPLQALYLAGLRLQRASQDIVPIDTGNLRGSAFTAKESDLMSVMAASEGRLLGRQQKQGERHAKKMAKRKAVLTSKRAKKVAAAAERKSKGMADRLWGKAKSLKTKVVAAQKKTAKKAKIAKTRAVKKAKVAKRDLVRDMKKVSKRTKVRVRKVQAKKAVGKKVKSTRARKA